MKVLLVDDEPLALKRLQTLFANIINYTIVGLASNGQQALEKIKELNPDIVILDIQMPIMTGLEVASQLKSYEQAPAIIFCTAYDEFALQAIHNNAVEYLLKPIKQDDLITALDKASRLNKAQIYQLVENNAKEEDGKDLVLTVRSWRGLERIPYSRLLYMVASQKYVTIYHKEGEIIVSDSLKTLEAQLGDYVARIHRNTIVMENLVRSLVKTKIGHQILLKDIDRPLAVSRRYYSELKKRFNGKVKEE